MIKIFLYSTAKDNSGCREFYDGCGHYIEEPGCEVICGGCKNQWGKPTESCFKIGNEVAGNKVDHVLIKDSSTNPFSMELMKNSILNHDEQPCRTVSGVESHTKAICTEVSIGAPAPNLSCPNGSNQQFNENDARLNSI